MLTKKQLEDAARCNQVESCDDCAMSANPHDCLEMLAETALLYRAILEKLEWSNRPEGKFCPSCGYAKDIGHHADDCELAALLKEVEE